MAKVLTNADSVNCPHSPGAAAKTVSAKLKVGGNAVLVGLGPVSQCSATAAPNVPCGAVTLSAGRATKLFAGGSAVLLDTLKATAAGNPGGSLSVLPQQSKLTAV